MTLDIAATLREHQPVINRGTARIVGCRCMDRVFYKTETFAAHQAEKVWEALRADGREEWSVERDFGPNPLPLTSETSARHYADKYGLKALRRYVITTDWEEA